MKGRLRPSRQLIVETRDRTSRPNTTNIADEQVTLATIVRKCGRIRCIGFGGPPTHIALLRKLCVTERSWIIATEFEDGIAAINLFTGPGIDAAGDLLRPAATGPTPIRPFHLVLHFPTSGRLEHPVQDSYGSCCSDAMLSSRWQQQESSVCRLSAFLLGRDIGGLVSATNDGRVVRNGARIYSSKHGINCSYVDGCSRTSLASSAKRARCSSRFTRPRSVAR